jgi:hypothetical protein
MRTKAAMLAPADAGGAPAQALAGQDSGLEAARDPRVLSEKVSELALTDRGIRVFTPVTCNSAMND